MKLETREENMTYQDAMMREEARRILSRARSLRLISVAASVGVLLLLYLLLVVWETLAVPTVLGLVVIMLSIVTLNLLTFVRRYTGLGWWESLAVAFRIESRRDPN
jgi:hypothetical protein